MPPSRLMLGALWALMVVEAAAAAARCSGIKPSSNPVTAPGVEYKVLSNDLNNPRHLVMDTEGNLLVAQRAGGIRRLVLSDDGGLDVCVDSSSQIISNEEFKHGLALSQDGKTLFASSSTDVFAHSYDAASGNVGSAKNIITGMKETGSHLTRTLVIPQQHPNLLLVSQGSADNIDEETTDVKSGRSQIRIFELDKLLGRDSPVQYTDGTVLGWGLRNSVGIGEDPTTGNIWSVENSLDDMKRSGKDIHNDNPGEELNFHGRPNDTGGEVFGKNYGYPSCLAIWKPEQVDGYPGGAAVGKQMTGDHSTPQYNDTYCQTQTVAPRLTFGAHMAPLDVKFQDNGAAAFISLHGSWDRSPPDGYRLIRIDFSEGMPKAPSDSREAEVSVMWNADKSRCPGACFRPVGLLVDGSERLFMTSDATGELFVLTGFEA